MPARLARRSFSEGGAGHSEVFTCFKIPARFSWLAELPQTKVAFVFLLLVFVNPGNSVFGAFNWSLGQFAVIFEVFDVVINAIPGLVGQTLFKKFLDLSNDFFYMVCGFGVLGHAVYLQAFYIFQVFFLKALSQRFGGDVLVLGPEDDFIVNVCDILQIKDTIAFLLEILGDHIKSQVRSGMADVREIVRRDAADKKFHFFARVRLEDFLLAGERIVDLKHNFIYSIISDKI